jgi:hypothetical protein
VTIQLDNMMDNPDYGSMNSNRTSGDNQQQDGRRNRGTAGSYDKVDFRFLIPSRDAGGWLNTIVDFYLLLQNTNAAVLNDCFHCFCHV